MNMRTDRQVARQVSDSQWAGVWAELNEVAKAIALTLVIAALLLLMAAYSGQGL